jgi:3-hydroxy-9,10-secoandrosta-1,3,5(10)-triene-9,17-dione monooxygenase
MNSSRRCFFCMNSATLDTIAPELSGASLRQALVASARQLQPLLERNASRTEADRRVVEENLTAIRSADLLKLAVPRRFGGLETDIRTMLEVSRELGRGCGSTAWVTTINNSASRFLGAGSAEAQKDVWGQGPDVFLFGSATGVPTVEKVSGGLLVSGKWTYASGCLHGDWGLVMVPLCNEAGEKTGQALGLCRASELVIEDTWHAAGMKGSGSHTIVAQEVFIPDYRVLSMAAVAGPDRPTPYKDEALFRSSLFPSIVIPVLGPLLGMAARALEYVIERAPEKGIAQTTYQPQSSSIGFQASVGNASMLIETAHLQAYSAGDTIDEAARDDRALSAVEQARLRMCAAQAAESLVKSVDLLMYAHGSSAFMEQNPLQRIWRDIGMAGRHAGLLPTVGAEVYGRALLGIEETAVRVR